MMHSVGVLRVDCHIQEYQEYQELSKIGDIYKLCFFSFASLLFKMCQCPHIVVFCSLLKLPYSLMADGNYNAHPIIADAPKHIPFYPIHFLTTHPSLPLHCYSPFTHISSQNPSKSNPNPNANQSHQPTISQKDLPTKPNQSLTSSSPAPSSPSNTHSKKHPVPTFPPRPIPPRSSPPPSAKPPPPLHPTPPRTPIQTPCATPTPPSCASNPSEKIQTK